MHTHIAIRFRLCLHVRILHLFLFNHFFQLPPPPPAQNDFFAHEAEEQVQIGRPGT